MFKPKHTVASNNKRIVPYDKLKCGVVYRFCSLESVDKNSTILTALDCINLFKLNLTKDSVKQLYVVFPQVEDDVSLVIDTRMYHTMRSADVFIYGRMESGGYKFLKHSILLIHDKMPHAFLRCEGSIDREANNAIKLLRRS